MNFQEYDLAFEGIPVHCWEGGRGFPILLLHGSGPGASVVGNFRLVMEGLAERYHVLAMDWIGFGRSGRLSTPPFFDMELWARQAVWALERLPGRSVGLIAHSLAGAIALQAALSSARVAKILATGSMGTFFPINPHLTRIWTFPGSRQELRQALESLVHDRGLITPEFLEGRWEVLQGGDYAGYFGVMFGGDKQQYVDASALAPQRLRGLSAEVLFVHGRQDLPIPFEQTSWVLAETIPRADLWLVSHCGHSPALEHPHKLLAAARSLFG